MKSVIGVHDAPCAPVLAGAWLAALVPLVALAQGCEESHPPPTAGDLRDGSAREGGYADAASRDDAGDTEPDAGDAGSCEVPELQREPGERVSTRSATGDGPCAGKTLGAVIDAVHAADPSLDDIDVLFDPQRALLDQSYVHAFRAPDGGFALAFRRGGGDCPAGCTENEYWYFRTDRSCVPAPIGHYHPRHDPDRNCLAVDGFPLWDHPPPIDPLINVCGYVDAPWAWVPTGEQTIRACGQRIPCLLEGEDGSAEVLALDLRFTLTQDDSDPSRGTLMLHNTGHPAIDGRPLSATVERGRVRVQEHVSNLPAACIDEYDLEITLDFDGYGASLLHFDEVRTPGCGGASDDYCKGGLYLEFGNLVNVSCIATRDLDALIRRERTARGHCAKDGDCAVVQVPAECLGVCPTSVRTDEVDAFAAAVSAAAAAYCAEPTACFRDDDCPAAESARCRAGLCEPVFR